MWRVPRRPQTHQQAGPPGHPPSRTCACAHTHTHTCSGAAGAPAAGSWAQPAGGPPARSGLRGAHGPASGTDAPREPRRGTCCGFPAPAPQTSSGWASNGASHGTHWRLLTGSWEVGEPHPTASWSPDTPRAGPPPALRAEPRLRRGGWAARPGAPQRPAHHRALATSRAAAPGRPHGERRALRRREGQTSPRAPRTGGKPPGNTQTSGVTAADRARVETWEGDSRTSARAPRCRGRDTERSHPGVRAPALPRLLGLSRCALRPTTSCALTGCSHAAPQSANRDDGGAGPAAGWQGDRRQRPRVGVSARGHRRRPFLPGRDGDAGLARSTPDRGQLGSPRRSEEADGTEGNKRFGTTNGHEDWCSVFKWPKAAAASSEPAKLQTFVSRSSLLQLPGQPPRRPRAPVALGDSCCPRRGRPSGPSGSTALRAHAVSLAMQVMAGDRRSQALAGVARAGDGCPVCKAFFPVCRESPALPPHRVESRRPTGPGEGRGAAP